MAEKRIRAIMHGCNGKMGQTISGLIAADEEIEIVAGIDAYDKVIPIRCSGRLMPVTWRPMS